MPIIEESRLSSPDVFDLLGNVCAMKGYSEGYLQDRFGFNLKAQLNLDAFSAEFLSTEIGAEFMRLLGTDLRYLNGSSLKSSEGLGQIGVVMGNSYSYEFYNYVPFFSEFKIPTIGYGISTISEFNFAFNSLSFGYDPNSVYEIGATTGPSIFAAGIQALARLNWSLVSVIFSSDDFGFYGQKVFLDSESKNANLSVSCPTTIPQNLTSTEGQQVLQTFVTCIKNVDNVSAVVLWMNYALALEAIEWFRKNGNKKLNFVIVFVDKDVNNFNDASSPEVLENVLFMRTLTNITTPSYIRECSNNLKSGTFTERLAKFVVQCMDNGTGTLPDCISDNPTETSCTCTQSLSDFYKNNLVQNRLNTVKINI